MGNRTRACSEMPHPTAPMLAAVLFGEKYKLCLLLLRQLRHLGAVSLLGIHILLITVFSKVLTIKRRLIRGLRSTVMMLRPVGWLVSDISEEKQRGVLICIARNFCDIFFFSSWIFHPRILNHYLVSKHQTVVTQWRGALFPEERRSLPQLRKPKTFHLHPIFSP